MIDTHCHLDFDVYNDRRDEIVAEANAAGVHTIINIGVDPDSSVRSVELAHTYDSIYAAVGVHPHDAKTLNDEVEHQIRELAHRPKVVAIGEIGLDYYRNLSPRSVQRRAFCRQMEMAVELGLPIVIHTRESFQETVDIVREYAADLTGGVFHCFPGNVDDAFEVIDLGFAVSFGGVITFKNAKMAHVATRVPLDKIILETDAPFLSPEPYRGKENHPAYVMYVYRKLAELRGISVKETEQVVDRTAQKLFRLVDTYGG